MLSVSFREKHLLTKTKTKTKTKTETSRSQFHSQIFNHDNKYPRYKETPSETRLTFSQRKL